MNTRLQQFLQLENLTPARFADIMGVQRSNISHLLSGRNKPGYDFIRKFLDTFPNINPEWFLTGKGKPYKEYMSPLPYPQPSPALNEQEEDQDLFSHVAAGNAEDRGPEENVSHDRIVTEVEDGKAIKRITVFFSDGTFREFFPSK